jgi:hypothetical protein
MTNVRRRLRLALFDLNRPRHASGVEARYFYHPGSKCSYSGSQKPVGRKQTPRTGHYRRQPKLAHELSVFIWLAVAGGLIAWMQWHS